MGDTVVCDIGFGDEVLLLARGYIILVLFEDRGGVAGDMCSEFYCRIFHWRKRFSEGIESGIGAEEYDFHHSACGDVFLSACGDGADLLCAVAQLVERVSAVPA